MDAWPPQTHAITETIAAIERGCRRILVTAPTGGGKSYIMQATAAHFLALGWPVVLYTNRKWLLEQTSDKLTLAGIEHGIRAAGHEQDWGQQFQIASIQTEHARSIKRDRSALHKARLVLVDEAHLQKEKTARVIFEQHRTEHDAVLVGYTATPIDLGKIYETLIVAGTNSAYRACGALVPAVHYAPDEPDLRGIKAPPGEDLSENQVRKAIMREGIFGRVLDHYRAINPENKPTLLFAPGVAESVWFAEQFCRAGIPAAHIDGQEVWVDGQFYRSDREARADVLQRSRDRDLAVLCNRFVLREGIDAPWLYHGIFATIFGSLQSYLQSGGRLLRAYPGMDHVTLQDHGGNWWRHGSLNADRDWSLDYTASMITGLREERLRAKKCRRCKEPLQPGRPVCRACGFLNETEPFVCPECKQVLVTTRCPCGYEVPVGVKSRAVVQSDGTLREMRGDLFKARRLCKKPNGPQLWERMYWRSRTEKGRRTFRAAMALFAQENYFGWPDPTWPFMPRNELDFFRQVADVPFENLIH